jgi:hypothetical protein
LFLLSFLYNRCLNSLLQLNGHQVRAGYGGRGHALGLQNQRDSAGATATLNAMPVAVWPNAQTPPGFELPGGVSFTGAVLF